MIENAKKKLLKKINLLYPISSKKSSQGVKSIPQIATYLQATFLPIKHHNNN